MEDRIRAKHFNPDVAQRQLLQKIDLGYRKLAERDSTLLPLSHESVPQPTVYRYGDPSVAVSLDAKLVQGEEFLQEVAAASDWVIDFISPLFGPAKLFKMVVTEEGIVHRSGSLGFIIRHAQIQNPLAQLLIGSGLAVHAEYGDHATYTGLLAALAVKKCTQLLLDGLAHRTDCLDGLEKCMRIADTTIGKHSRELTLTRDVEKLLLTRCKGWPSSAHAEAAAEVVLSICDIVNSEELLSRPLREVVDFRTMPSSSFVESMVVSGVAFPKELPHPSLPDTVEDARIAILKDGLNLPDQLGKGPSIKHEWGDPQELRHSRLTKQQLLISYANQLADLGANVVVVEKGIDGSVIPVFASRGVMAIRRFAPPEIEALAKATGARPTPALAPYTATDLGKARLVKSRKISGKEWVFFEGCRNASQVTVILKGHSSTSLLDVEENIRSLVTYLANVRKNPSFVPGGGAIDHTIALELRRYAENLAGRVQLVVGKLADAFEDVISQLIRNTGADPVENLTHLRSLHEKGEQDYGFVLESMGPGDVWESTVVDSSLVKRVAVENALTAAYTIMRLDAGFTGRRLSESEHYYLKRTRGQSKERKRELRRDFGYESLE